MKYLFLPAIVMASCAMLLNAQSDSSTTRPQNPSQKQDKPDYVGLNECIGAKVSMNAGTAARADAADRQETATRPTGEITDLLIATQTGHTEWAVVSFGGLLGMGDKTVAVPFSVLQWNPTSKSYDLDVSQDHLKALNAFDAKKAKLQAQGLDEAMVAHAANWHTIVTPSSPEKAAAEATAAKAAANAKRADKPVVTIAGTTMVGNPAVLMCASEIDDYPLYARGEDFGTVSNSVVDRANSTVAFVIVGHGGVLGVGKDQYLLPFSSLQLAKKGDATVLVVDKSAAEMASCVKYTKPVNGIVDAEAATRCCATVGAKEKVSVKGSE